MGVPVRLRIVGDEVTIDHGEVRTRQRVTAARHRIDADLRTVTTARRRAAGPRASGGAVDRYVAALDQLGRRLGEHFLAGPTGAALTAAMRAAQPGPLRVEVDVPDHALTDLPWEALVPPGETGPLGLDLRVQVCRTVDGGTGAANTPTDGPLRILAVVASPERGGDTLLDYEAEVDRLLSATDPAVHGGRGAEVDVLEWGTLTAIEEAVRAGAYHVVHVTAHADAGTLRLEDDDGYPDDVTTARLAAAVLSGAGAAPVVVLAACSTGVGTGAGDPDEFSGLARGLMHHGVPTVLAMTSAVNDAYATDLAGAFYRTLVTDDVTDPLTALTRARHELEDARRASTPTSPGQNQVEWWVPALYTRVAPGPLYRPDTAPPTPRPARATFVGRRGDVRELGRLLRSPRPFLLLHGLGGSGVRTLAGTLLARLAPQPRVVQVRCDDGVDGVLRDLREALGEPQQEIVGSWLHHLQALHPALRDGPVALVAEVPDDALRPPRRPGDTDWRLADPQLARFLAAWTRLVPAGALLIVAGRRFTIGGEAPLHRHQVGPLDPAEARKLARRLSTLDPAEQARVREAVGGHPGTYRRIGALADRRGPGADVQPLIDRAVADSVDEAGVHRLADHTDQQLLADVAVFPEPVDADAFTPPASGVPLQTALDRLCASGLVARTGDHYLVDRWVAGALLKRWPELAEVAHRRAATYWRTVRRPDDPAAALLYARDHLAAVGERDEALRVNDQACRLLADVGRWAHAHEQYLTVSDWVDPGSAAYARTARAVGDLWALAGDDAEAEAHFDRALITFRRIADEGEIVETLRRLGEVALRTGEATRGRRLLDEARARAEALGAALGIANTYRYLGRADVEQHRYTEAEVHLHRALALYQAEGDHRGVCLVQLDLGDLYRAQRLRDEARIAYHRARNTAREHLPTALAINALHVQRLGALAEDSGDLAGAEGCYRGALEAYEALGDLPGQAQAHRLLAHLEERHDRPDAALAAYREALERAEDASDLQAQARALTGLAGVHQRLGRTEEAMADTVRAFRLARDSATPAALGGPLEKFLDLREKIGAREFDRVLASAADPETAALIRRWMRRHDPVARPRAGKVTGLLTFSVGLAAMSWRHKPRQLLTSLRRDTTGYVTDRAWPTFLFAAVTAGVLLATGAVLRATGLPQTPQALLFTVLAGVEGAVAAQLVTALRGVRRAPGRFAAIVGQPVVWMAGAGAWLGGLACDRAGRPVIPAALSPLFYPGFRRDSRWGTPVLDVDLPTIGRLAGYALLAVAVFVVCAACAHRLRATEPLSWPTQLRLPNPRRGFHETHVDVLVRMVKDDRRPDERPEVRRLLLDAAAKAYASGAGGKAAEALAWAYDIDERSGRWPTMGSTVHELAARTAESVTTVCGPVEPDVALALLDAAAERDPLRGRTVLAAYCSHLWRNPPDGQPAEYQADLAVRAVQIYTELLATDMARFRPYVVMAFADQAASLRVHGDMITALELLRFAITTLKEHDRDVDWWRVDLAAFQAALARWLIELGRTAEAAQAVGQMLADVDDTFTDPEREMPPALREEVANLTGWAERSGTTSTDEERR